MKHRSTINQSNNESGAAGDSEHVEQSALFPQEPSPRDASTDQVREPQALTQEKGDDEMQKDAPITPEQVTFFPESFTQRLVAARDSLGWSAQDVAAKLKLPVRIVQAIESQDYSRIGEGVYLRGYLTSYARLVGVPVVAAESVMKKHSSTPELIATGRISHTRYLVDRYSKSALYLVLTGVIFVPLVMLALNSGNNSGAHLTSLDIPASTVTQNEPDAASTSTTTPTTAAATNDTAQPETGVTSRPAIPLSTQQPEAPANDLPLMAGFVPNLTPASPSPAAVVPSERLRLSLKEASWVDITDVDGKRVEYGTLPAGTIKSYAADKALTILLGNSSGATVEVDGQTQDLTQFNRGNVARFRLATSDKAISHVE